MSWRSVCSWEASAIELRAAILIALDQTLIRHDLHEFEHRRIADFLPL
jgi:hypothetical protein